MFTKDDILALERAHGCRLVSLRRAYNRLQGGKKINRKYLPRSLSKSDYAKEKKHLSRLKKAYKKGKYLNRPKLKSFKSKESPHVKKAKALYKIDSMKVGPLSRKTGCSKASLNKILDKGRGAYYSSGSRPNQTAESWAKARLASTITGGKAAKVDCHLLKQGKCGKKVMGLAKKVGCV